MLQGQPHDGASAVAFRDCYIAALRLSQLPDDVKTKADTAEPAPITGLALDKAIKYSFPVLRPDTGALVLNRDNDHATLGP